jgi:limonene-1,2-epoxide hydrolase
VNSIQAAGYESSGASFDVLETGQSEGAARIMNASTTPAESTQKNSHLTPDAADGPTRTLVNAFTAAMTTEGVEPMLKLWAPDGEWVVMATGESFRGINKIRELATRSVAARVHKEGQGLLPFNLFTNPEGTRLCWEYVHKGVVTDKWPASSHPPAVGTTFELPIMLSCDILDGKLIKIREYFDLPTLTEAGTPHHLYS